MIVFYYPQNTPPRMGRLPMSLLALAAVIDGRHDYTIVDGNVVPNALDALRHLLRSSPVDMLAVSVMPGAQMADAIRDCRIVRREFPRISIVWGGYFPSMHTDAVLNSTIVDYAIRGQGEKALPELINALQGCMPLSAVHNLSRREGDVVVHNPEYPIYDPNDRPLFPYHRLKMDDYALPTFVGRRTMCHETSVGCPHKCNFCGVVDVFNSRWKAEHPERTIEVLRLLQREHGMDGVEFHDSDFFVSEKRVAALSGCLVDLRLQWWGEGRIDTLLQYDEETWRLMKRSGLKMIFFGAESGLDETLKLMDKGGVTVEKTKAIAERCRKYDVQSEFSFVMGSNPHRTEEDIDATIDLMYELERINPKSQMHPFIYTPVPFGAIYDQAVEGGLRVPKTLDEWASSEWTDYTLRRNPHTPWLTPRLRRRITNFRAVHQCYYPKVNDRRIAWWKTFLMKALSGWRYKFRFFAGAFEARLLLKLFVNSSPLREGF